MHKSRSVSKPEARKTTDSRLQKFFGYHLKRAGAVIQADMNQAIEPLGLRMMSFSALAIVVENPNISQTRLSQRLNIERSGVVPLVDELENAGLIGRHRVEGDRRSYALRATEAGQALWEKAEKAVFDHEEALFADISPDTLSAAKAVLYKIWSAK